MEDILKKLRCLPFFPRQIRMVSEVWKGHWDTWVIPLPSHWGIGLVHCVQDQKEILYRGLLKQYMALIFKEEDSHYLMRGREMFTPEEIAALEAIAKEVGENV